MVDITYISFGSGVQSTAVLAMSNLGIRGCARASDAIFADTGDEPQWVYDHLEQVIKLSDIPIHVVQKGVLSDSIRNGYAKKARFAAIPAFTMGTDGRAAPLRRQCTREYKIEPIEKKVRELMGYRKGQHIKHNANALIGISLDEVERARDSRTKWATNCYPLLDVRMRRSDCYKLLADIGWPIPKKSSCVYCPYHSDAFWLDLKQNHPSEWTRAVEFDRDIRDASKTGINNPVFLHRSLKPLDQVNLGEDQPDLFIYECEGYCGV